MGRFQFRITWTIGVLFTGLNLVGIGAVLLLGVRGAERTAAVLQLERRADAIENAGDGVEQILRPAAAQANAIADAVRAGRVDLGDPASLSLFLEGAVATTPQVAALDFIEPNRRTYFRRDEQRRGLVTPTGEPAEWIAPSLEWVKTATAPRWIHGWSVVLGGPVMMRQTPLRRDGELAGVLVSVVTIQELEQRLAVLALLVGDPVHDPVFLLFERDVVIAHSNPDEGFAPSRRDSFPTIAQAGDPILARMWDRGATPLPSEELAPGVSGHRVAIDADEIVFVYRGINIGGDTTYLVGTYHRGSRTEEETERLRRVAAAGLAVLVGSILLTILIGHRISEPVRGLAGAARVIERQDYGSFRPFGTSRIREIDEAGRAFNHMVEGLKERERIRNMFGKYVPQEVVERLLADPSAFALGGERREVSLLFTDITGFTALAETMPPGAVLKLLNEYFDALCRCVHAEQGIVADLIGDAVFAIFGAPIARPDHARRAVACARAMRRAATEFSAARRAQGVDFGTTRIGLHVGFATVGNYGSDDRLKYSAVGDVVNITARLESANKHFGSLVLASRAIVDEAGDRDWRPLAALVVKGRRAALDVVEILPPEVAAEGWVDAYRAAYALLETGSPAALASWRALAGLRPDDPVIRFHRERVEAGVVSAIVELTEK